MNTEFHLFPYFQILESSKTTTEYHEIVLSFIQEGFANKLLYKIIFYVPLLLQPISAEYTRKIDIINKNGIATSKLQIKENR